MLGLNSVDGLSKEVALHARHLVAPFLLGHLLPLRLLEKVHGDFGSGWGARRHSFRVLEKQFSHGLLDAFVWLGRLKVRGVLLGAVLVVFDDK